VKIRPLLALTFLSVSSAANAQYTVPQVPLVERCGMHAPEILISLLGVLDENADHSQCMFSTTRDEFFNLVVSCHVETMTGFIALKMAKATFGSGWYLCEWVETEHMYSSPWTQGNARNSQ